MTQNAPPAQEPSIDFTRLETLCLEGAVWVAAAPIGSPTYDFDFTKYFSYRRLWYATGEPITAVGRFGVAYDYPDVYAQLKQAGVLLVHSPQQHYLAANLDGWYPHIAELTARSRWYETPPAPEEVEQDFTYPIFIRGAFQTNRHKAASSVVHSREEYLQAVSEYRRHPRLKEQAFVVREYLNLRPVQKLAETDMVAPAFEFRSFWWQGELVGFGNYWNTVASYTLTRAEEIEAKALAHQVTQRVKVPFLVVDVAQEVSGRWVAIECNDGQESGYAGVPALVMWQKMIKEPLA